MADSMVEIDLDRISAERAEYAEREARLLAKMEPLQQKLDHVRRRLAQIDADIELLSSYAPTTGRPGC